MTSRIVVVEAPSEGTRIDRFLADHVPDSSRGRIQKLIDGENVTVDGRVARSSDRLRTGQRVTVQMPPPESTSVVATEMPLNVVVERADLLILNKPAGLVVHPAPGHPADTVANALMARYPNLVVGNAKRPGIVHRLDRDTSGLMVVALSDQMYQWLIDQMATRQVHKEYLALVHGSVGPPVGSIEAPIGRDHHDRQKMGVVPEGRDATTGFRVVERFAGYTLLRLKLETGRTHQIRVHLAAIGHPVAGDVVYGKKKPSLGLSRQFLHAWYLGFALPGEEQCLVAWAPLPPELASVVDLLRAEGPITQS